MTYQVTCLGDRGLEQDTQAEVPQRLVLSRVVVDGGSGQIQRCVGLNSGATAIVDSWLMNCHIKGFEGHGIAGWNGTGPYLIENNYVEAAGINFLFGGATPTIANLRISDITIRRNHVTKQLAWGPAGTGAGPWTEKNLLETKNAARVLIEANVFENSWQDAQPTGSGIMIKSINDEGTCGWCQSTDVTIRRNFGTNIETPIVVSAAENYNDPSRPPPVVARVRISENVFDNIGAVAWGAKAIQLTAGHSTTGSTDVAVERNVITQGAGKLVAHMLLLSNNGVQRSLFRDNVWTHAAYPLLNGEGAFGVTALSVGAPDAAWSNMWLVKSPNHTDATPTMPAGTSVVTAESSVPLAAQLRALVATAVAGVVISP
jgi:hypothetical protein